jgi:hypothetical protein
VDEKYPVERERWEKYKYECINMLDRNFDIYKSAQFTTELGNTAFPNMSCRNRAMMLRYSKRNSL